MKKLLQAVLIGVLAITMCVSSVCVMADAPTSITPVNLTWDGSSATGMEPSNTAASVSVRYGDGNGNSWYGKPATDAYLRYDSGTAGGEFCQIGEQVALQPGDFYLSFDIKFGSDGSYLSLWGQPYDSALAAYGEVKPLLLVRRDIGVNVYQGADVFVDATGSIITSGTNLIPRQALSTGWNKISIFFCTMKAEMLVTINGVDYTIKMNPDYFGEGAGHYSRYGFANMQLRPCFATGGSTFDLDNVCIRSGETEGDAVSNAENYVNAELEGGHVGCLSDLAAVKKPIDNIYDGSETMHWNPALVPSNTYVTSKVSEGNNAAGRNGKAADDGFYTFSAITGDGGGGEDASIVSVADLTEDTYISFDFATEEQSAYIAFHAAPYDDTQTAKSSRPVLYFRPDVGAKVYQTGVFVDDSGAELANGNELIPASVIRKGWNTASILLSTEKNEIKIMLNGESYTFKTKENYGTDGNGDPYHFGAYGFAALRIQPCMSAGKSVYIDNMRIASGETAANLMTADAFSGTTNKLTGDLVVDAGTNGDAYGTVHLKPGTTAAEAKTALAALSNGASVRVFTELGGVTEPADEVILTDGATAYVATVSNGIEKLYTGYRLNVSDFNYGMWTSPNRWAITGFNPAMTPEDIAARFADTKTVTIPKTIGGSTVTFIAPYAFYTPAEGSAAEISYPDLDFVFADDWSGSSSLWIGSYAFSKTGIKSVKLGVSAEGYTQEGAFFDCDSLTDVTLDKYFYASLSSAFANCDNLENLTMKYIQWTWSNGNGVFANCPKLTELTLKDANKGYIIPNVLDQMSGLKTLKITDGGTISGYSLMAAAYDENDKLVGVSVPVKVNDTDTYTTLNIPEGDRVIVMQFNNLDAFSPVVKAATLK